MGNYYGDWNQLVFFLRKKYHLTENINSILFFIGLQETGKGFRSFTREEKTMMILTGQEIVSRYDLQDEEDNTFVSENIKRTKISSNQTYDYQMKKYILNYFNSFYKNGKNE
ncbi:MAG: hypothetical protein GXO83_05405 [Chlorobi bacterium]|nr:hypothetical protein [Chlorobiota bacterium]